jgi:SAM-dependent methyltransferase
MVWSPSGPKGNEAAKCRDRISQFIQGNGLDLGCADCKITPRSVGIDRKLYSGQNVNLQGNVKNLYWFKDDCMDYVFSSHVLEDMPDPQAVLREWWRVIKPGGYLILYLPHKSFYPNIGQPGANKDHKNDFIPNDILEMLKEFKHEIIKCDELSGGIEYSFEIVARKL